MSTSICRSVVVGASLSIALYLEILKKSITVRQVFSGSFQDPIL
jgi:hypothetical protein